MEKGIYVSPRILKLISEGGKTDARIDCIEIDIQTALETASRIESDDLRYRFLGRQYEELANNLKILGLINIE